MTSNRQDILAKGYQKYIGRGVQNCKAIKSLQVLGNNKNCIIFKAQITKFYRFFYVTYLIIRLKIPEKGLTCGHEERYPKSSG